MLDQIVGYMFETGLEIAVNNLPHVLRQTVAKVVAKKGTDLYYTIRGEKTDREILVELNGKINSLGTSSEAMEAIAVIKQYTESFNESFKQNAQIYEEISGLNERLRSGALENQLKLQLTDVLNEILSHYGVKLDKIDGLVRKSTSELHIRFDDVEEMLNRFGGDLGDIKDGVNDANEKLDDLLGRLNKSFKPFKLDDDLPELPPFPHLPNFGQKDIQSEEDSFYLPELPPLPSREKLLEYAKNQREEAELPELPPRHIEKTKFKDNIEKALEIYDKINFSQIGVDYYFSQISKLEKIILNPSEIDLFLQRLIRDRKMTSNFSHTTIYLSKLIQDSYNFGNNDFVLTLKDFSIGTNMGYKLKGTKINPIRITINGNIENFCGKYSKNLNMIFHGNVGSFCGNESENFSGTFKENVGKYCGSQSQNFNGIFYRNVGEYCGYESENFNGTFNGYVGNDCGNFSTNFNGIFNDDVGGNCGLNSTNFNGAFNGNVGNICGWGSTNFTFKTSNKELYEKMESRIKGERGGIVLQE